MARSGGGEGTVTVLFQLPHFFMASFLLGHRGHGGLCPRALAVPRPRQWPCVCRFRTARDAVGARARAAERRRPLPASARVTGAHAGAAPWPVRGASGRGGGGDGSCPRRPPRQRLPPPVDRPAATRAAARDRHGRRSTAAAAARAAAGAALCPQIHAEFTPADAPTRAPYPITALARPASRRGSG